MNDIQPHMMNMNRNYGAPWGNMGPPPPPLTDDSMKFMKNYPPRQGFVGGRGNWKGKRGKKGAMVGGNVGGGGGSGTGGVFKSPALHELQSQNRVKAKRFYPKKKFNNRFAPFAPRNTSSFIIRAKKSGGIASFVSPYPVTPAVLPSPVFSPSNEVLGDMAKEEWGVDGYGSMNGLIRLRLPGNDIDEEEEEGGGGSSESDVEEHVEVERRLDHDLSRFEMIYPNNNGEDNGSAMMFENQSDEHVVQLEEENLTLKERLFLMERELVELKMRLQCLETESLANKEKNGIAVVNKNDSKKEENNGKGNMNEAPAKNGSNEEENTDEHDAKLENEGLSLDEKDEMNEVSENEDGGDVCSDKSLCDSD